MNALLLYPSFDKLSINLKNVDLSGESQECSVYFEECV